MNLETKVVGDIDGKEVSVYVRNGIGYFEFANLNDVLNAILRHLDVGILDAGVTVREKEKKDKG